MTCLLSKTYAAERRGLIGPQASDQMRPGDVGRGFPDYAVRGVLEDNRLALAALAGGHPAATGREHMQDTTHLDAVDREGNMVAATPSGGWIPSSPVIAGLGFPLGTRGQMFYLNAQRPNALAASQAAAGHADALPWRPATASLCWPLAPRAATPRTRHRSSSS